MLRLTAPLCTDCSRPDWPADWETYIACDDCIAAGRCTACYELHHKAAEDRLLARAERLRLAQRKLAAAARGTRAPSHMRGRAYLVGPEGAATTRRDPNGRILWEGASRLDGAPIVVIATGLHDGSGNRKTGAAVQTWILRADVDPVDTIRGGLDGSICGDCPHRSEGAGGEGTCYTFGSTLRGQGAPRVWQRYAAGEYLPWSAEDVPLVRGRFVRLGAYGDPAAAPLSVWETITEHAGRWAGYTHQWTDNAQLQPYCMASVDSAAEGVIALAHGWRYFRVRGAGDPLLGTEIVCPASDEAGKRLTCADCGACAGTSKTTTGKSVVIIAHGFRAGRINRRGDR